MNAPTYLCDSHNFLVGDSEPVDLDMERHHAAYQRLKQCETLNKVALAYASRIINENRRTMDPALHVCELVAQFGGPVQPSLHVDDHPGYSIVGDNWVALLSAHRDRYNKECLEAKQDSGHARVLSCTLHDDLNAIVRSIQQKLKFAYVDASRMFNRVVLVKLFCDVLPHVLDHGAWLVVRLKTPSDADLAHTMVDLAALFETLTLNKPQHSDCTKQEIYAIYKGYGTTPTQPATLDGWWFQTQMFMTKWESHVTDVCDLFHYLHACGIETDTQCRKHFESVNAV